MSSLRNPPWVTIRISARGSGIMSPSSKLLLRPELTLDMVDGRCSKSGERETFGQLPYVPVDSSWGADILLFRSPSRQGMGCEGEGGGKQLCWMSRGAEESTVGVY
jgi:hypothetical protein